MNNGAWSYAGPRIYTAASQTVHHKGKYPFYAGREPTSSVATGSKVRRGFFMLRAGLTVRLRVPQSQHKKEIESFINTAFDLSR